MITHPVPHRPSRFHPSRRQLVAFAGAAFVLALAAGIVGWQMTGERESAETRPAAVAAGTEAAPVSDQEMYQRWPQAGAGVDTAQATGRQQAAVRSPEVVLVIVASEEAAAVERAALQADQANLAEVNMPPPQVEVVVVVTTPEEERRVYQSAAVAVDSGFTVTVIDARPPRSAE